jgi:hypothetical protein
MRWYCVLVFLTVNLAFIVGCDDNSEDVLEDDVAVIESGGIFGKVTDGETDKPIKDASVSIGDNSVFTDEMGKYIIEDISFSDGLNVVVTATDHVEYKDTISLHQELLSLDVSLMPVDRQSEHVLAVFDVISREIAELDTDRIPSIQSCFSTDFTTGEDDATLLGVFFGVVPPSYNEIPDTIENIVDNYIRVKFSFTDPEIKFKGDFATVLAYYTVVVETDPPDPKQWELVIYGRFDFRRENGDWKITYWEMIPPFIKFVERRL